MNQVGPFPWREFLWRLPLHRAHDMAHEALAMNGRPTRWPEQAGEEESRAEAALKALKAMRRGER